MADKPLRVDQSRNGVRVIVSRYPNGTTVDASCQCFGAEFRSHSTTDCRLFKRQQRKSAPTPEEDAV